MKRNNKKNKRKTWKLMKLWPMRFKLMKQMVF